MVEAVEEIDEGLGAFVLAIEDKLRIVTREDPGRSGQAHEVDQHFRLRGGRRRRGLVRWRSRGSPAGHRLDLGDRELQ